MQAESLAMLPREFTDDYRSKMRGLFVLTLVAMALSMFLSLLLLKFQATAGKLERNLEAQTYEMERSRAEMLELARRVEAALAAAEED